MHLAGVPTAVASCGTAFGAEHVSVIRRLMGDDSFDRGEVIYTFDGDAAGQAAALKAFDGDQSFAAQTFVVRRPGRAGPLRPAAERGRHRGARPRRPPRAAVRVRDPLDPARARPRHRRGSGRARCSAASRSSPRSGARTCATSTRAGSRAGRAGTTSRWWSAGCARARGRRPSGRARPGPPRRRRPATTPACTASARRSRRRCRCRRSPGRATTSCPSRPSRTRRTCRCTAAIQVAGGVCGGREGPAWLDAVVAECAPEVRGLVSELAVEPLELPQKNTDEVRYVAEHRLRGAAGPGRRADRGDQVAAAADEPGGRRRRLPGAVRRPRAAGAVPDRPAREGDGGGGREPIAAATTRCAALPAGGDGLPDGFAARLEPDERVLATARTADGAHVVVTSWGCGFPTATRRAGCGWHLVSKATWKNGALAVVEAVEVEEIASGDGPVAVLLADRPARRFRLADAGAGARGRARPGRGLHPQPTPPRPARRRRLVRAAQGPGPRRHRAAGAPGPGHGPARCGARRGVAASTAASGPGTACGTEVAMSTTWDPAPTCLRRPPRPPLPRPARPASPPRARAGSSTWAAARGTSPRCSPPAGPAPPSRPSTARAEMVEAARARGIDARRADVVDWTPAPDTDVVISNAVLQWVPQHRDLLPRGSRRSGGAPSSRCRCRATSVRAVARPRPRRSRPGGRGRPGPARRRRSPSPRSTPRCSPARGRARRRRAGRPPTCTG